MAESDILQLRRFLEISLEVCNPISVVVINARKWDDPDLLNILQIQMDRYLSGWFRIHEARSRIWVRDFYLHRGGLIFTNSVNKAKLWQGSFDGRNQIIFPCIYTVKHELQVSFVEGNYEPIKLIPKGHLPKPWEVVNYQQTIEMAKCKIKLVGRKHRKVVVYVEEDIRKCDLDLMLKDLD